MNATEVKVDPIEAILEYITHADKPLEERFALLLGLVKVHVAEIAKLKEFRAKTCTAAWALAMPGSDAANFTGFEQYQTKDLQKRHYHQLLSGEARDAVADLAGLNTSGYAPMVNPLTSPAPFQAPECGGPAPEGGSNEAHSLYAAREPTSVRRPPGSSPLPPVKGVRPS